MPWADLGTFSAVGAGVVAYACKSVFHLYGTRGAVLLAYSAADAANVARLPRYDARLGAGTSYPILGVKRDHAYKPLRAGGGAGTAGGTQTVIHCRTAVYDADGVKLTRLDTASKPYTPVRTELIAPREL